MKGCVIMKEIIKKLLSEDEYKFLENETCYIRDLELNDPDTNYTLLDFIIETRSCLYNDLEDYVRECSWNDKPFEDMDLSYYTKLQKILTKLYKGVK